MRNPVSNLIFASPKTRPKRTALGALSGKVWGSKKLIVYAAVVPACTAYIIDGKNGKAADAGSIISNHAFIVLSIILLEIGKSK